MNENKKRVIRKRLKELEEKGLDTSGLEREIIPETPEVGIKKVKKKKV